jgi:hypothetical protein
MKKRKCLLKKQSVLLLSFAERERNKNQEKKERMSFIFLLFLLFEHVTAQCPPTCSVDSDCSLCAFDQRLKHGVFLRPELASVIQFGCYLGNCRLDPVGIQQGPLKDTFNSACYSRSGGDCCLSLFPLVPGFTDDSIPISFCNQKKCKVATGCNPIGFCEYDENSPKVNQCCQEDNDCPPLQFSLAAPPSANFIPSLVVPLNPYNQQCGIRKCELGGNCFLRHTPFCCRDFNSCIANTTTVPAITFKASQYICDDDLVNGTSGRACSVVFPIDQECFTNDDCGGDGIANQCAKAVCNTFTNRCVMTARNVIATGCCRSGSPTDLETCKSEDKCRAVLGCSSTVQPTKNYFDEIIAQTKPSNPTFKCLYEEFRPQGCCNANADCEALADSGACVGRSCNLFTNQCNAPDVVVGRPVCAAFSADCGIPDPDNLCIFSLVTLNTDIIRTTSVYRCTNTNIGGCVPATNKLTGILVPIVSSIFKTPDACNWACGASNENTITVSLRIQPVGITIGPLYNFTIALRAVSAEVSGNRISSVEISSVVMLSSSPQYKNRDTLSLQRQVSPDMFPATNPRLPGLFPFEFRSTTPLYPDESILIQFDVVLLTDPLQLSVDIDARIFKQEPCTPFYEGFAPNCNSISDHYVNLIDRDTFSVPLERYTFNGVNCSEQCFETPTTSASTTLSTTSTTPVTPSPTPSSTVAPNLPEPDPLPLPSSIVLTPTVRLEASLLDCSWDCNDEFDGSVNRILVKLKITPVNGRIQAPVRYIGFASDDTTSTDLNTYTQLSDNNRQVGIIGATSNSPAGQMIPTPNTVDTNGDLFLANSEDLDVFLSIMLLPTNTVTLSNTTVVLGGFFGNYPCDSFANANDPCVIGTNVTLALIVVPLHIPWSFLQCSQLCGVEPPKVPIALTNTITTFDCQFDCAEPTANLVTVSGCVSVVDFGFVNVSQVSRARLDGFLITTAADTVFSANTRLTVQGQVLTPTSIVPVDESEFLLFKLQQPFVFNATSTPVCWKADVTVNSNPYFFNVIMAAYVRCSILELYTDSCPVAYENAPIPIFSSFSGSLSTTDARNANEYLGLSQPGDVGGLYPLTSTTSSGTQEVVEFDSSLISSCSEACDFVNLLPGFIGGLAFFDGNGDGSFVPGTSDQIVPGLVVSVFTATSTFAIATTVTDVAGVYRFNRSALFSTTVNAVFLRIAIPGGANLVSPLGNSGNRDIDNVFVRDSAVPINSARTVGSITRTTPTAVSYSFGYQDRSTSCVPALGPLAGNTEFSMSASLLQCAETLPMPISDETDHDYCKDICDETFGATHRVFDFLYVLDNTRSPAVKTESVVVTEMQSNLCVQSLPLRGTNGVEYLSQHSYDKKRRATAAFSFEQMLPGTERRFIGRWSTCTAPLTPLRFNNTITLFEDRCIEEVRGWRTCRNTTTDPSDCYNEVIVLGSACTLGTVPPAAVLRESLLSVTPRITREFDSCIVNRRIDSFLCAPGTQSICQANPTGRAVVVAATTLSYPSSALVQSERGVLEISLERNMSESSCSSNLFDPQIEIKRSSSTQKVVLTRSQIQDSNTVARVGISFDFMAPGSSIDVVLRTLECGPALQLNYTLTAIIITEKCPGGNECRNTTLYSGPVSGVAASTPCVNLTNFDDLLFLHSNLRGRRIEDVDEFKSTNASSVQFWLIVLLTFSTLLIVGCLVVLLLNRRKPKKCAPASSQPGTV